jgi:polyhydroxybutyrate depolymerase
MRSISFILLLTLAGCGEISTPRPTGPTNAQVMARPYDTNIPASYSPDKPTPLVLLLHGFTATPFVEDAVFGLTAVSDARGFLYAMPSGTHNSKNEPFWNATDQCCDTEHSGVDDAAYLAAVIDDMQARYNVDPKRIFITGHSNGGFMSYRMACDSAPRLAAIVSLAGAMWGDVTRCQPTDKVAVLQVHGDHDSEVPYEGFPPGLPSAHQSVADWAAFDGCSPTLTPTGQTLDLDARIAGAETVVERHDGCAGGAAELWTVTGANHVPTFNMPGWGNAIFDWMMAHPKP